MTRDISPDIGKIRLLLTEPHDCSYLDNHKATTAFVDPETEIDTEIETATDDSVLNDSGKFVTIDL